MFKGLVSLILTSRYMNVLQGLKKDISLICSMATRPIFVAGTVWGAQQNMK